MTGAASHLAGGFAEPVFQAQSVFRAVLDAMARPCSLQSLSVRIAPPPPLLDSAGAVILALADPDTPVFLDPHLATSGQVASWIRFHTGAPIVQRPEQATFAIVSDADEMPGLGELSQGTAEYPDRSATVILQTASLSGGSEQFLFRGPGIEQTRALSAAGLPPDFAAMWSANNSAFPLGVDLILAAPGAIAALPRSAALVATGVKAARSQTCT